MIVKDIMTAEVRTLLPTDTIKDALNNFAEHNIHGAPVVNSKGELVGIFTESDMLVVLQKNSKNLKMVMSSLPIMSIQFVEADNPEEVKDIIKKVLSMKIKDAMTKNVRTLGPDDKVKQGVEHMNKYKITRIPICEDKKLVGIVTRQDIIEIGLPYKKENNK